MQLTLILPYGVSIKKGKIIVGRGKIVDIRHAVTKNS